MFSFRTMECTGLSKLCYSYECKFDFSKQNSTRDTSYILINVHTIMIVHYSMYQIVISFLVYGVLIARPNVPLFIFNRCCCRRHVESLQLQKKKKKKNK